MEQGMNPVLLRTFEVLLEGKWAGRTMVFVLIPLLLLASALLPPVSLVERALSSGHTTFTKTGGSLADPDGTQLTVPPGAASDRVQIRFSSVPQADFLSGTAGDQAIAQAIPSNLEMKSPLYVFSIRGAMPQEAILSIPIPNDAESLSTLDLYAWTGAEWQWLPKMIFYEDDLLEANLATIPPAVAVMQTTPVVPSVTAPLPVENALPSEARQILVAVEAEGLSLQSDGIDQSNTVAVAGGLMEQPGEGTSYLVLPSLSNEMGGVVRTDLVNNILVSEESRSNHIEEIVNLVVQNAYPGVNVDYRGVHPGTKDQFTAFLTELGQELHSHHKLLTVTVEAPVQIAEDRWETGAYDWQAIGQVVDSFKLPGITELEAYAPGGQMEALLGYAVNQVDRYRIEVLLPTFSSDWVGDSVTLRSYAETLQMMSGKLTLSEGRDTFAPGDLVTARLSGGTSGVNFHEQSQSYWFNYSDEQGEHTVWIENATSMAHKLDLILKYNLKGVNVPGLLVEGNDEQTWAILQEYVNSVAPVADAQFAVVWTVESAVGASLVQEVGSLTEPVFAWTAPEEAGEYSISAAISDDGGQTSDIEGGRVSFMVSEPTPTPSPTPTPTPSPTPRPSGGSTQPAPTPTQVPPSAPAPAGTGFGYGIQMNQVNPGNLAHMNALGFKWIKIQIRWSELETQPGFWDWGGMDGAVALANGAGKKLLFSVVTTPHWARSWTQGEGPPDDPASLGNFVGQIAERYCGQVGAIEVWNEENLATEWTTGRNISAREYVDLLKVSYNRIKSACPGMIVVSGAPTPVGFTSQPGNVDDFQYLRELYQAGLKNYCDAVGVHPSGFSSPPDWKYPPAYSEPGMNSPGHTKNRQFYFLNTIEGYHNIMVQFGDGNKKLWATEFGWAATEGISASPNQGYEYALDNTEQEQAEFIVEAYQIAKQKGYMGVMFLWNLDFALASGAEDEKAKFGILRPNGTRRPAYDALAAMPK